MYELGSVVGVIVVRMLLLILLCLYEIGIGIGRLHLGLLLLYLLCYVVRIVVVLWDDFGYDCLHDMFMC